jgi:hypothetical protein
MELTINDRKHQVDVPPCCLVLLGVTGPVLKEDGPR